MYYDRNGDSITMEQWASLLENREYARIALDVLPNGLRVSTVWMGLDHAYDGGIPLIYESMVFDDANMEKLTFGGRELKYSPDLDQRRYATEAGAIDGHRELVAKWSGYTGGEE